MAREDEAGKEGRDEHEQEKKSRNLLRKGGGLKEK